MAPWVLHVDLDQFIAAVELLRRPEARGRPVIVGGRGDPTERAVVSTASYEAREFGVRSGMPLKVAVRRCPQAVLLPVDAPLYEAASEQVMETLRGVDGTVVEVLGWDEAFVGVDTDDPEAFARLVQSEVLAATDLHCSVGIGDTKIRAKIATDFGKPQGVFRLTRENWFEVMGERPTSALWGSAPASRPGWPGHQHRPGPGRRRPGAAGRGVRAHDGPALRPAGPGRQQRPGRRHAVHRAGPRPGDDLPAEPHRRRRGCAGHRVLAEQVVKDIAAEGRPCMRVHLKVRFAPFFTVARSRKAPEPTYDAALIGGTALDLLRGLADDRPIRLLGVRAEMVPPEGGYDDQARRTARDPRAAGGARARRCYQRAATAVFRSASAPAACTSVGLGALRFCRALAISAHAATASATRT